MEAIPLIFSGLNSKTLIKYLTIKEFPLQPTVAFVIFSVSISSTDGWTQETVIMEERLAVKVAVTTTIANSHGASSNRAQGFLNCSPAFCTNVGDHMRLYVIEGASKVTSTISMISLVFMSTYSVQINRTSTQNQKAPMSSKLRPCTISIKQATKHTERCVTNRRNHISLVKGHTNISVSFSLSGFTVTTISSPELMHGCI